MHRLTIPSSPERQTVARWLLYALAIFGIVTATIDFVDGKRLSAAASALIASAIFVALRLARLRNSPSFPLHFSIWLLFCMLVFGTLTQMPMQPEKTVWAIIFPFAFFYLGGLQIGLLLTAFSLILTLATYFGHLHFGIAMEISAYAFTQTFAALLLSGILAYLYERIRTQQEVQLHKSAQCDPLTGLLNRRGFENISAITLRQALCSGRHCAIALIDLDDFKLVNDTRGHEAGDSLLMEVSSLLRSQTRCSDIIARWGGEEFLLLLHTDLEGARQLCEKIRAAIASHAFDSGPCSASIGVALHTGDEPIEATIRRADHAMYQAKSGGKDKVVCISA